MTRPTTLSPRRPSKIKRSDASASSPMFRPNTFGPPDSTDSRAPVCDLTTAAKTPSAAIANANTNKPPQNPSMVARTPQIRNATTVRTHDQMTNIRSYALIAARAGSGAQRLVTTMYPRNTTIMPPQVCAPRASMRFVPATAAKPVNQIDSAARTHTLSSRYQPVSPTPMKRSACERPTS